MSTAALEYTILIILLFGNEINRFVTYKKKSIINMLYYLVKDFFKQNFKYLLCFIHLSLLTVIYQLWKKM